MRNNTNVILLTTLFVSLCAILFAQTDKEDGSFVSIKNTFERRLDPMAINDYTHLIKEDSLYNITVDLVWEIKKAYFIAGHTIIADTIVCLKILVPKAKAKKKDIKSKIKKGDVLGMRLFRYYPYRLNHSIDYYYNYNLLFGKRVVCLQATDCFFYIFTTNNLKGLNYLSEDSFLLKTSLNIHQEKETVSKLFFSIIQNDKRIIRQFINASAIKTCQRNKSCSYSIVDHQDVRCLPPVKIGKNTQRLKLSAKDFDFSDMLLFELISPYLNQYTSSELEKSVKLDNIDLVFSNGKYRTYRILWNCSLLPSVKYCTFLSLKTNKKCIKLIGLSSFDSV